MLYDKVRSPVMVTEMNLLTSRAVLAAVWGYGWDAISRTHSWYRKFVSSHWKVIPRNGLFDRLVQLSNVIDPLTMVQSMRSITCPYSCCRYSASFPRTVEVHGGFSIGLQVFMKFRNADESNVENGRKSEMIHCNAAYATLSCLAAGIVISVSVTCFNDS